jgi:hypothetical protein
MRIGVGGIYIEDGILMLSKENPNCRKTLDVSADCSWFSVRCPAVANDRLDSYPSSTR